MSSYTFSNTQTFTLTHARYLASKVAADLKRMQRFYGFPSDLQITNFEGELTELLKHGYLSEITYGFKRDGNWIEPTLRYSAKDLAGTSSYDDDPGKIRPNADVKNASFYSFLVTDYSYLKLSDDERKRFESTLPISRGSAAAPGISGYMSSDKTYSSGGKSLDRSTLKTY